MWLQYYERSKWKICLQFLAVKWFGNISGSGGVQIEWLNWKQKDPKIIIIIIINYNRKKMNKKYQNNYSDNYYKITFFKGGTEVCWGNFHSWNTSSILAINLFKKKIKKQYKWMIFLRFNIYQLIIIIILNEITETMTVQDMEYLIFKLFLLYH